MSRFLAVTRPCGRDQNNRGRPGRQTALSKIQTIADATADAVVFDPLHMRLIDSALIGLDPEPDGRRGCQRGP